MKDASIEEQKVKCESEMIRVFVNLVGVADLNDVPRVMEVSMNIVANSIGCGIYRRLKEDCDCTKCRVKSRAMVDSIIRHITDQLQTCLDLNLTRKGLEPLYGPNTHNTDVTREILHEIEATEKN